MFVELYCANRLFWMHVTWVLQLWLKWGKGKQKRSFPCRRMCPRLITWMTFKHHSFFFFLVTEFGFVAVIILTYVDLLCECYLVVLLSIILYPFCRLRAASKAQGDGAKKTRTRVRAIPAPEANAEIQTNIDVNINLPSSRS